MIIIQQSYNISPIWTEFNTKNTSRRDKKNDPYIHFIQFDERMSLSHIRSIDLTAFTPDSDEAGKVYICCF